MVALKPPFVFGLHETNIAFVSELTGLIASKFPTWTQLAVVATVAAPAVAAAVMTKHLL